MLVLRLGVLYTVTNTRMLPMKAAKQIIAMVVVKNTETAYEHDAS